LAPLARALASGGDDSLLLHGSALSAATLFPGAVAVGATFPFAVRLLAGGPDESAAASGRVFAWNTVGAILGSLATGYLVLPALGFASTATLATATSLLLAAAAALLASPRRRVLLATALAGLLALAVVRPDTPWATLRHGPLSHNQAIGEVAYHGVGRSANVLLFARPAGFSLFTNGLPESGIDGLSGRAGNMTVARWLSLLAVAARPDLRSLLVVGLGAGVTVEEVPASVDAIHVVELEPEVVRAVRSVGDRRRRDPLSDPRLHLHVDDARGALRLTERRFDAIASQPSHPWTSAASHLFTREFAALVRDRLTPSGVFVQWMGLPFVDEELLRSLVATALEVFPHVELYHPGGGGMLVLASAEPLELATSAPLAIARDPASWARFGVLCAEDVLAARVLDPAGARGFAAGAAPITDLHNRFQTHAPRILRRALGSDRAERLWAPHLPELDRLDGVDVPYLLLRVIRNGDVARARSLAAGLADPTARRVALGRAALAGGDREAGEYALREALRLDPQNRDVLAALLGFYRPAIVAGEAVAFGERFTADPEAAVIAGWRASAAGDWTAVRALESRLADIGFRHPLFEESLRLRAAWRSESGDPGLAGDAVALLEPILAPSPRVPDLLLRARAAAAAGETEIALATLDEALPRVPRGSELAKRWHQILRRLPVRGLAADWYLELENRFRRPPREDEATAAGG
jgi:hypothetical protein